MAGLWISLLSEGEHEGVPEEVTFEAGSKRPQGRSKVGLFQEEKKTSMNEQGASGAKVCSKILRD